MITDYYEDIFKATTTDWEEVVECVEGKITTEHNAELLREDSEEEVKHALFQINPDKVPGPDGMTPTFFWRHWDIVGKDIVALVRKFLRRVNCLMG